MGNQKKTAEHIRCSVCGAQCLEDRCGALHGDCPNGRGGSVLYFAQLCESCFFGAMSYLRQEREAMNMFNDESPVGHDVPPRHPGNT